jgi:hypothetical protein
LIFCRLIFLFLAIAQWVPIAREGWQYYRYWGENGTARAIEHANSHPRAYRFWNPPAPARSVCAIENRPGVYWFTPDGKSLRGTFPTPNPGEFNVSPKQTGIRGFAVTAAFAGWAVRTGAVESVYFSDRACSDGGVEYGFSRDLATNSVLVYWSTFANCANDGASLCRKTDDASLGANFSNVQQENGGTNVQHGFRIYGLDVKAPYTYKMFVKDGGFRVEVSREAKLIRCSEQEGAPPTDCAFEKKVQAWFPIDRLADGYVVAGTQTAGDPGVAERSEFRVSDILVDK